MTLEEQLKAVLEANDRLTGELEKCHELAVSLAKALARFADYGRHFPDENWPVGFETVLMEVTNAPNITVDDCRRATRAFDEAGRVLSELKEVG